MTPHDELSQILNERVRHNSKKTTKKGPYKEGTKCNKCLL